MRTWSIRPLKYWPQMRSLPIVSGLVELVIAAACGLAGGQRPVHIQAQGRPVVGRGQIRPAVGRQRASPIGMRARPGNRHGTRWHTTVVGCSHQVVVVVALVDHVPPGARDRGRINPRLQGHARAQLQRGRVGHIHPRARAVERQRAPVLARTRPGRTRNRARVPVPRRIRNRRARPRIKRIRRHQPRRRRRLVVAEALLENGPRLPAASRARTW